MIRVVWDWSYGDRSGEHGWLQRNQPEFDPVGADFTVAHDALEHFPARYGDIADECIALGALVRGRGLAGTLNACPIDTLSYELNAFFEERVGCVQKPPSHMTPMRGSLAGEAEEIFTEAVKRAVDPIPSQAIEDAQEFDDHCKRILAWMRIGYRRCERRFPGSTPWHLACLFDRVKHEGGEYLRRGEVGDTLHLAVNPRTLEHEFRHVELYS